MLSSVSSPLSLFFGRTGWSTADIVAYCDRGLIYILTLTLGFCFLIAPSASER